MFKSTQSETFEEKKRRAERRIKAAQRTGHQQNYTEKAMLALFARIDPKYDAHYRDKLKAIADTIAQTDKWEECEEWRISTSYDSRIERTERAGKDWYVVTVSCDGQILSCGCPTVERAFAFMHWYQHMIVYQFYSVGAPWREIPPFEP